MKPNYDYEVKTVKEFSNGEGSAWTKIGVGFLNKDGSINLKLDCIPIDPNSTIQIQKPKDWDEYNAQKEQPKDSSK